MSTTIALALSLEAAPIATAFDRDLDAADFARGARSAATLRAYRHDVAASESYCQARGVASLPASRKRSPRTSRRWRRTAGPSRASRAAWRRFP